MNKATIRLAALLLVCGTIASAQNRPQADPDNVPAIVAHELVHFQQKLGNGGTVLAECLREGSADFLGELISGKNINEHLKAYGDAHEKDLWNEFEKDMRSKDVKRWMYQGNDNGDRPSDLGYYVGYKITASFYEHATDKKAAIVAILNIGEFDKFLDDSGYASKFR